MTEAKAVIEAVLFLESQPIDIHVLAKLCKLSVTKTRSLLQEFANDLMQPSRGLTLIFLNDTVQLTPKTLLAPFLMNRFGKKNNERLSRAAIETLAVIAYSQPITRKEIENLRGVSCDSMLTQLIAKNLIQTVGRKNVIGQPVQYGTTLEFLRYFNLNSITELPQLEEREQQKFTFYEKNSSSN